MVIIKRINESIDNWFKAPMDDVLSRLGLFRIIFALFCLWFMSDQFTSRMGALDERYFHIKTLLIEFGPKSMPLDRALFLEVAFIFSLVLLLFGRWTRLATAGVGLVGTVLFAYYNKVDPEHGECFFSTFIPFAMLIDGRWGKAWSLDAVIARGRGLPISSAETDDQGRGHSMGVRTLIVLIAALFFSAFYFKIVGTWLQYDWVMGKIVAEANVKSAVYGTDINPLGPWIIDTPWMYGFLRWFTLAFEAAFILIIFSGRIRDLVIAITMLFHTINGIYFVVTFTCVIITYAAFINWHQWIGCWLPVERIGDRLRRVPPFVLSISALLIAVVFAGLWNAAPWLRQMMNLGGLIDQRTIWFPLAPVTLFMWIVVIYRWIRGRTPLTA